MSRDNHDHIDEGTGGGRKERGMGERREVGERRKRVGERWRKNEGERR